MKVVLAMDSFKGTLSARQATCAVRRGLLEVQPQLDVVGVAMADGGEGTAEAALACRDGTWIPRVVPGPLPGKEVEAGYAWFPQESAALVEMATASGLPLLRPHERDPSRTTTRGTGELVLDATRRGARQLWLAVGGSATVDGGVGAATALGWRFLDAAGKPLGPGGGELVRLARIEPPGDLRLPAITALCDVDHPLCGPRGAAATFGPQKGATAEMVEQLDRGLQHLARTVREQLGRRIDSVPGSGAGGGMAAGALAFMNAALSSGVKTVMGWNHLEEKLLGADWVVTGEGRCDEQSLHGKVMSGVVELARRAEVKAGVIAGTVALAPRVAQRHGICAMEGARPENMPLIESCTLAEELLVAAARRFASRHLAKLQSASDRC